VSSPDLRFRPARSDDAKAVAALHADSWQRHYRGAYSDAFLDRDAVEYLSNLWVDRLADPSEHDRTIVAECNGEVVGLAHTVLAADPTWGALLDNLHVRYELKRQGIGARLLVQTAQALCAASPAPLHLWVLEQNRAARAFYKASGALCIERADVPPPGGVPTRLNGRPMGLRYAWLDPSTLLTRND
jgi:ribosomal protein S18 acetylase RimI-like enzyme